MDKNSELSYLHLIAQLEEENKLLRDEAKHLRLTIKDYLNKKKRMKIRLTKKIMKHQIYHIDTPATTTYFQVADGKVSYEGKPTNVSPDKLILFLAIARELGLRGGEL